MQLIVTYKENHMPIIEAVCSHALTKAVVASCGTVLFVLIGDNGMAYQILFILVTIDFTTGLMLAIKEKKLNSRASAKSVRKLLIYMLLVIAAHQLTRYQPIMIWLEDFTVLFLAMTEMISIMENATGLGVPFPIWVKEKLKNYYTNNLLNGSKSE